MPKTINTSAGRKIILPAASEAKAIARGIAADPDTYEPSDAEFAQFKPQRGRPVSVSPKVHTGIRLDADVLARFKGAGPGWQTRINAVLRDWLQAHPAR
ncbi:MAG: BrnA antitoxin family protein [Rhodoferax sp.]